MNRDPRDPFRESLSEYDRAYYDRFVTNVGRPPKTMWELMCWGANFQASLEAEREALLRLFGFGTSGNR